MLRRRTLSSPKQPPALKEPPPPPPMSALPRHLLALPTELLLLIIQFASSGPPPGCSSTRPSGLQTLINLSRTCKALHYTVFCEESDEAIWRNIAITRLGMHPNMTLDKVTYSGTFVSSKRRKRIWRDVVKLGVAWERPFPIHENSDGTVGPAGEWKVQKALRSFRPLPAPRGNEKESGWGVEMVCPGDGDARAQRFETKMPVGEGDQGRITFQVRRQEGGVRQQGVAAPGAPPNVVRTRTVTAVVDLLGKGGARVGSRIRKGKGLSKVVHEEVKPGTGWTMTPYPGFCGFIAVEIDRKDAEGNDVKEWVIKQVDPIKGTLVEEKVWDLGRRRPDRFVGDGDVVVALCFDDPQQEIKSESPDMPANLVCLERVKDKSVGWLGAGETWRSRVRWELSTQRDWKEDNYYTAFAHLKNFHVSKHHLVALITRHPTAYFQKLTGTFFYVIDLETGRLIRRIKLRKRIPIPQQPSSSTPPLANLPHPGDLTAPPQAPALNTAAGTPAAFTTAFNHDFLLTDNYLICGGPGGGLHVYNYCLPPQSPFPNFSSSSSSSSNSTSQPTTSVASPDDGNPPLYTLPDPWSPASPFFKHNSDLLPTPSEFTSSMQGLFVGRQFSGLTLSTCGRYLGATTSDQFWVWDMVRKRVRGVWSNGRKVDRRDWYARSPGDGWVGGVWILLNYHQDQERKKGGLLSPNDGRGRGRVRQFERAPPVNTASVGRDEEEEEEEEEEIMVGYLTDLGVPEPGSENAGDGRPRGISLGVNLRMRERWDRWRRLMGALVQRVRQADRVEGLVWFGMAAVLAVFAVVMGWGGLSGEVNIGEDVREREEQRRVAWWWVWL